MHNNKEHKMIAKSIRMLSALSYERKKELAIQLLAECEVGEFRKKMEDMYQNTPVDEREVFTEEDIYERMSDSADDGQLLKTLDKEVLVEARKLLGLPERKFGQCPGCGCESGDGITETCEHPDGCGFWKALANAASES